MATDMRTAPSCGVDRKTGIGAGVVAGAVFMMVEAGMLAMTGQSPWGPPRMMAAIVLSKGVVPPPATFDMMIMMVGSTSCTRCCLRSPWPSASPPSGAVLACTYLKLARPRAA